MLMLFAINTSNYKMKEKGCGPVGIQRYNKKNTKKGKEKGCEVWHII